MLLFIQLAGDLSEFVHMPNHWSTTGHPRAPLRQKILSIFLNQKEEKPGLSWLEMHPWCTGAMQRCPLQCCTRGWQHGCVSDEGHPPLLRVPHLPPRQGWGSPSLHHPPALLPTLLPGLAESPWPWAGTAGLSLAVGWDAVTLLGVTWESGLYKHWGELKLHGLLH